MIDVGFDFASDSPGYWDSFWENNDGLGGGGSDPDSASAILQRYNQELWSKELPNGEKMELVLGENGSLLWNVFGGIIWVFLVHCMRYCVVTGGFLVCLGILGGMWSFSC